MAFVGKMELWALRTAGALIFLPLVSPLSLSFKMEPERGDPSAKGTGGGLGEGGERWGEQGREVVGRESFLFLTFLLRFNVGYVKFTSVRSRA